jgi:outer membrane protein
MRKIAVYVVFLMGALALVQCNKPTNPTPSVTFNPSQAAGGKIVFVNLDSLYNKYNLYNDTKKQLDDDYKKADAAFGAKMQGFQKRAGDFQRRVVETQQRAQDIAPVELQKLEAQFGAEQKRLGEEEAALAKQRDAALGELEKKIQDLQNNLKTKIDGYLEKIATERGYDYVMIKGSAQGGVLYGNKSLDITEEAVKALNEAYATEKK